MKIVTPNMCGWGTYDNWEGSFWRGQYSYELPINPDFWDKVLFVLSSTEGKIDSVNCYDKCVCSLSIIQLCDGGYLLGTNLLGYIADNLGPLAITNPLSEALKSSNAAFKKFDKIGWRFQFLDSRGRIDNIEKQRELYLKCSGIKGQWSEDQKYHNKLWTCGLANIWHNEDARLLQIKYVKEKIKLFISPSVKKILFDEKLVNSTWLEVAQAAYMSYSANNPTRASKTFFKFSKLTSYKIGTKEWTISLIQYLTFDSGIKLYEDRYNKIRSPLENIWNVELPNSHIELKDFFNDKRDTFNHCSNNTPSYNQLLVLTEDKSIPNENELEKTLVIQNNTNYSIVDLIYKFIEFLLTLFKGK